MRKNLFWLMLFGLFLSCDPMSGSKIYVANNSSYDIIIEIDVYEIGKKEVIITKGKITELTKVIILGTNAPDPVKHVLQFSIFRAENRKLLKSFKNMRNLYKEFLVKRGSFGSEMKSYMIIITNESLR